MPAKTHDTIPSASSLQWINTTSFFHNTTIAAEDATRFHVLVLRAWKNQERKSRLDCFRNRLINGL